MRDLFVEHGYDAVTEQMICARAGIQRTEFDAMYESKEDCFMSVFQSYIDSFTQTVRDAYEEHADWVDGIRAAAYAAAAWLRDHPDENRLGSHEFFLAGDRAIAMRADAVKAFMDLVDEGRRDAPKDLEIPPMAAEAVLGSISQALIAKVQAGGVAGDQEIVRELIFIAVLAYRGREIAERELAIPPP